MTHLDYDQRKALRRLERGQTINHTMQNDPVIKQCYSTDHYIEPDPGMNVVEYCDWEAQALCVNRPRINDYGTKLLQELEANHD